jgi:hypothetical protein
MTDETALKLASAIDRLVMVIERAMGANSLNGGIQVYHHNAPNYQRYDFSLPKAYYPPPNGNQS